MLTPEEAKKRLDTLCDKDWRAKAEKRIGKLPRHLREPAAAFAAPQPPWGVRDNKAEEHRKRQLAAARALDGLPESDRAAVMAALHPGLGAALTRWWADARRRPYTRGWDRRAFRADDPSLTVGARASDLAQLTAVTGQYDADPAWLAIWGSHLSARQQYLAKPFGDLLASAIDVGGPAADETFAALIEVGNGEHPVGVMGRHVIVALLGSARSDGWDFVTRLLLAAQRQEGLRQSILEAADEGHPGAFDCLLNVVLDHKLLRFAASVRAAGVWLGFGSSVAEIPLVEDRVRKLAVFRASETERDVRRRGLIAELRPVVIGLLSDRSPAVRRIAIEALGKTRLAPSEAPAIEALLTRAATDLRRGALTLLASVPPKEARASAARLAASADSRQRDAAAELLREIGGGASDASGGAGETAGSAEGAGAPIADLHAVFAAKRVPVSAPKRPAARRNGPGGDAKQVLLEIASIAARHRDVPVTISWWQGTREMLFGDIQHFPSPFGFPWQARRGLVDDAEQAASGMVLGEVFREWWAGRPAELRGEDEGLDALRAHALATLPEPARAGTLPPGLAGGIVSAKTLLLARDHEIKDPTILEQLVPLAGG
jgi:hypothetical protein